MSLKSGHRIVPVYGEEQDHLVKDFTANAVGTIRLQPDGWFFTSPFIELADKIYDFEFKQTDILVMTYPKSGTTWMQEVIWTLRNNPDLSNPLGELPINIRCPTMETDFFVRGTHMPSIGEDSEVFKMFTKMHPERNPFDCMFLQMTELSPDPRTIKTHVPFSLLKPTILDTCKVVYMIREPKDVAVSLYYHAKIYKTRGFVGNLDSFVNHFVNNTLFYSPYWTHVKNAWMKRSHPNIYFIHYDDMKQNPKREIIRLQNFLGLNLNDSQINKVVEHTSFEEMKKRDNLIGKDDTTESFKVTKGDSSFFRKGISGDWKNNLTEEQANKIDEWTRKNIDADFGPDFKCSLN